MIFIASAWHTRHAQLLTMRCPPVPGMYHIAMVADDEVGKLVGIRSVDVDADGDPLHWGVLFNPPRYRRRRRREDQGASSTLPQKPDDSVRPSILAQMLSEGTPVEETPVEAFDASSALPQKLLQKPAIDVLSQLLSKEDPVETSDVDPEDSVAVVDALPFCPEQCCVQFEDRISSACWPPWCITNK